MLGVVKFGVRACEVAHIGKTGLRQHGGRQSKGNGGGGRIIQHHRSKLVRAQSGKLREELFAKGGMGRLACANWIRSRWQHVNERE